MLRFPRRFFVALLRACWAQAHQVVALAIVVALFALAGPASAATSVSGTISTNTTWTLANSPYVMTGSVTVAAGVTLTIEPGVVVQGNAQSRTLAVNGSLSAVGTAAQPITFTSTSDSGPGQWYGIVFQSGAGASTLEHVNVRYGGAAGISAANAMVGISAGTITVEDSSFTGSSVSAMTVSGAATSVVVRRSKLENNGFVGSALHGNGMYVSDARVVIEDSAFWSNATDGLAFSVGSAHPASASEISGSSVVGNKRFGLYVTQAAGVEGRAPDGNVAGKPGNSVYDNGSFGFSGSETWVQFSLLRPSLDIDWRGTYWGPVTFLPCGLGAANGHLSYGTPDPLGGLTPVPRGPISHRKETVGAYPNHSWCANDYVLSEPPAYQPPDLYFDPPPPLFGGIALEQTFGCICPDDPGLALALEREALNPLEYTANPVNTASGSLTETATDLRLPGPGIAFAWTRSYNSRDTTAGALGPGWAHPFEARLTVVNPTTGELEYRSGSGQRTRFVKTSGGSTGAATYAGKGFDGTLKRLSTNAYELTARDQRTLSFDTAGRLTQIKPRFGPATTLAYASGKLSSITDSAGRTITVAYTSADPALIGQVILPDGRWVEYSYTSGRLTGVRDPRGNFWWLGYDASNRLTSIVDPSGRSELQNVVYDGSGRVTSEQNGAGEAVFYAYTTSGDYDVTTVTIPGRGDWVYKHRGYMLFSVTDPLNRTTSYSYDGQARRASERDARGYTTRFEYDERGNVVKEVAPGGLGSVIRTYNASNDVLTEKDARLNTTSYDYATAANADYRVGQLKTITDREGGVTTFKYWTTTSTPTPPASNVGLLKSLQNPRLKTTDYDYDAAGNVTKITSPLGLKTTMGYDSSGRRTSLRDPRGNVPVPPVGYLTEWTYDDVDHVTSVTDAGGKVTSLEYHNNELLWKVTTRTDGFPLVTIFEYDLDNRLFWTTDPRVGTETRLYWPDGQLRSVQSPEGRTTTFTYDAAGQLVTLVEPNGNAVGGTPSDWTWAYGYDNAGNRTSESHPDGGTRTISYDALNRAFEWRDALNHLTSVEYDANGNVTKRTNGLNKTRTYSFDKLDRLKTATDERLKTTTYAYVATGELASVITHLGNKTTYALDDDGRMVSMVEPRGNVQGADPLQYTWSYQYDEAGNRTRVSDPLNNSVQYGFDAVDNVTQVTDQRGNTTSFSYDDLNRLWKVTPPAAGGFEPLDTVYGYDGSGNLTSRTDPNGQTTAWLYDLDGRLIQRATEVGTRHYVYDANGNLKKVETPSGSSTPTPGDGTISYGYDRMSRQTSVDYSDSTSDVTRNYDVAGRLQTMTDGSGTVTYTFDDADRLTDIARSGGGSGLNGSFRYGYDDADNITTRTYPDATTATQVFDGDGRLTSVSSGGQTTSFGYDEAGNLTSVTLPSGNGHVATRSFDRAGRLTTVENARAGTILSKFVRTLDPAGNPTKQQTTRGLSDGFDAFEYDARNRLTASCYGVVSGATDCSGAATKITYAYDKVSNRTQEVRTGSVGNTGTIDYSYNAADQLTQTATGGNTTTYTYDANGNHATIGARTFGYDLAGRLASTTNAGTTTTYGYDGDGRRVSSTTSGGGTDLRYVWDQLADSGIPELALERTTAGGLVRRYVGGPRGAFSFTDGYGTFSYHHDPLGTVTDVTDASGAAQWKYEYEAYGTERAATDVSGSAPGTRLRFNGQYLDPDTGHYHLRARQYDPASGRFGALDPIENPWLEPYAGAYLYGNARPTVFVDPLGLLWGLPNPADVVGGTANAGAGVLDGATGGLSTAGLNRLGIDPNEDSLAFKAGQVGGTVAAVGSGGGLAIKVAGRVGVKTLGKRTVAASAGGSTTNVALGATRAAVDGRPYELEQAALDATLGALGDGAGYLAARCALRVAARSSSDAAKAGAGVAGDAARVGLEGRPIWSAGNQGGVRNAYQHFKDHGADFGAQNALGYVRQAHQFLHRPPSSALTRVRPNADIVRYDPISNTFGVITRSGAPRTFFKPDPAKHGYPSNLDYFLAQ